MKAGRRPFSEDTTTGEQVSEVINVNGKEIVFIIKPRSCEIFYNDEIKTRFDFKGKLKSTHISHVATVLRDLAIFGTPRDAREWIAKNGMFNRLVKLQETLTQKRKENIKKYEPNVQDLEFDKSVLILLKQGDDDKATEMIAQKFLQRERVKTIRDDVRREMYIYADGVY